MSIASDHAKDWIEYREARSRWERSAPQVPCYPSIMNDQRSTMAFINERGNIQIPCMHTSGGPMDREFNEEEARLLADWIYRMTK